MRFSNQGFGGENPTERSTAIGYVRVSTDEQAREGVSLDAQRARIRAYAEAKDLTLTDILVDEGFSGKNLKRPAMQELLTRCNDGKVSAVIVLKLDRLTRRTRHLLSLVEDLFLANDIEMHSVSESLDTSTPHGRFVLTLFGGLAQMEREQISDRTKAALAYKREQQQPTSHAPLGWKANGSKEPMQPVPEEVETIRQILDMWRYGSSYSAIARKLNADGIKTKLGGRWHHGTISRVVQRRQEYFKLLTAS
jgi:site-specific DNA recombinase